MKDIMKSKKKISQYFISLTLWPILRNIVETLRLNACSKIYVLRISRKKHTFSNNNTNIHQLHYIKYSIINYTKIAFFYPIEQT